MRRVRDHEMRWPVENDLAVVELPQPHDEALRSRVEDLRLADLADEDIAAQLQIPLSRVAAVR